MSFEMEMLLMFLGPVAAMAAVMYYIATKDDWEE